MFFLVILNVPSLQLKTSLATRQRYQMGQAEEEAHQLAFIQKHLPAILHLLAEPAAEGATDEVRDPEAGQEAVINGCVGANSSETRCRGCGVHGPCVRSTL